MSSGIAGRSSVTAQFVALAAAWGASFLFIKVALEGLSPAQVVLGRLVIGAVVLVAFAVLRREVMPRDPVVWVHLGVVAVSLCVAPFLAFAWAEQYIPSGLASVYNATTPLMTALIALAALRQERLTRARLAGLLIGFTGVLILLAPWRGLGTGRTMGQFACLLATACYGLAFVYLRRFVAPRGLTALTTASIQVGLAALMMLALSPLIAVRRVELSGAVLGSVVALGSVGTGIAYVWNTNVVAAWGATKAATVTYLVPVAGVVLGALVLAESTAWNELLGAAVVVVGIGITHRVRR